MTHINGSLRLCRFDRKGTTWAGSKFFENLNDLGRRFFPRVSRKEHNSSCLGVSLVRPSQRIHQAKLCPTFASREIVRCLFFKDANFVVIYDNGNGKLSEEETQKQVFHTTLSKVSQAVLFSPGSFISSFRLCLPPTYCLHSWGTWPTHKKGYSVLTAGKSFSSRCGQTFMDLVQLIGWQPVHQPLCLSWQLHCAFLVLLRFPFMTVRFLLCPRVWSSMGTISALL